MTTRRPGAAGRRGPWGFAGMRGRGAAGLRTAGLMGSAPGTSGNTLGLAGAGFAGRALRFGASGFRPGRGAAFHRDGAGLGGAGRFLPP